MISKDFSRRLFNVHIILEGRQQQAFSVYMIILHKKKVINFW